uniref:DUF1049 domain-containing protein n=1 Tax=Ignavibacterium album TaxID=591197 RepID=A0A7V2ZLW7_9BACT
MRYVYLTLIVIITIAVLLFKFQNLESVTVSFLSMGITLPTSILVFVVYIFGMLTGGSVVGFIRTLIKKSKAEEK